MIEQYVIETQMGPVQLTAPDDITAVARAKAWLKRCGFKGYTLHRYPLYWAGAPKGYSQPGGFETLILVPMFQCV